MTTNELRELAKTTPFDLDTILVVNGILSGRDLTREIVCLADRCAMDPVTLANHVLKDGIVNVRRRYNVKGGCDV